MLNINKRIEEYIRNPFPLWNVELAKLLVDRKWDSSLKNVFQNRRDYSISGCVFKDEKQKEKTYSPLEFDSKLQIAFPYESLSGFYKKHGIVTTDINILLPEKVEKISNALNILGEVTHLKSFIFHLVKSIQIIESENSETDISYSHPDIPFSIFFSVCEDVSAISDLRVAESILHETMHLMLTLIEDQCDLIISGSKETFYSPWRNEQRPLRGVLHGLFVFRAIKDLYNSLIADNPINSSKGRKFVNNRVSEIAKELQLLQRFPNTQGLTLNGKLLAFKLLQLEE